ncbi:phosphate/phosphite/phosphonate ABC transporter substrate-binding protein [Aestuariivirga sp.]|uniref:phosphate/phosphite/phosphonate ABC transporter substrate-binding protein n=1 Tax=Aestuariivirga sp. TaxID=2650926 RepID=UPI0035B380E8
MIAALQMYDWPEVGAATDLWWNGMAGHLGVDVPLSRPEDFTAPWHRDDLVFAQTCGYPFTHALKGQVALVGTPHYDADGCEGSNYCSIVFARERRPLESFRGQVAAVNTPDSMSGMLALKLVFAPLAEHGQFFGRAMETGGHLASLAAVQAGKADVCATDCVCVALARRYRPAALQGLVEIARSPVVPGLPWITRAGDVAALRGALRKAFADPRLAGVREALLLKGFSELPVSAYDRITNLEAAMERAGGLRLL